MKFETTHWSVVVSAQGKNAVSSQEALETLCKTYWQPVYAFLRQNGYRSEDAKDMTQEFFTRFLEKGYVAKADRSRGRFRTFLLTALSSFIRDEWRHAQTLKMGGGKEFVSFDSVEAENRYLAATKTPITPELLFERGWAMTILETALGKLKGEFDAEGKSIQFEALKPYLTVTESRRPYADVARDLDMSEGAVKTSVHRLRARYGEHIRAVVAQTLSDDGKIEDELHYLMDILS